MGKRKEEKETETSAPTPDGDGSPQPDVFKTLFGDVAEQSSFSSIFSDNNPFKRKHNELGRVFGATQTPERGDSAKVEVKKRKASKGLIDGATEDPDETAKPKKEKRKDAVSAGSLSKKALKKVKDGEAPSGPDADAVAKIAAGEASKSGLQPDEMSNDDDREGQNKSNEKDKKKRKKRKRDELERAYEMMKYGQPEEGEEGEVVKNGEGEKIVGTKRKKADNPADMLVAKEEGFDDEDKLLRTVFVGNLPLKMMKKKALLKEFGKFGEVESVRIRSVPILDTKVPRKGAVMSKKINNAVDSIHAYVVFKSEESAKASLAHNMAVVEGNHIRVDRACPPRKKLKGEDAPVYDNKRTVFVGNLPFDVKDEEVYQLFSRISSLESSIEAVRVVRDPHTSMGKGIAYVLFKTREAANMIVRKRNLRLRDRELRLSHSRPDSTPSKRSNPSPAAADNFPSKRRALEDSNTPDSGKKLNKADLSYQGLHGKKASSVALKKPWKKGVGAVKPLKAIAKKGSAVKERSSKRPSVAARKAKANAMREIGASSNRTDKKRKLGSRTPDSFQQKKKVVKRF